MTKTAALNHQLTTRTDYESDAYMSICEEVSALGEKFYALDLFFYDSADQGFRMSYRFYYINALRKNTQI